MAPLSSAAAAAVHNEEACAAALARELSERTGALRFASPVAYVYNPLEYARRPHAAYLERFGSGQKEFLMLGMNPGPFGMAQTGVPFGEIAAAREFLGIELPVDRPDPEHPKRPVTGFSCTRSEVSGRRLWAWCKERFGTAERLFRSYYVHNYCPLAFMADTGRNITPDKLPAVQLGVNVTAVHISAGADLPSVVLQRSFVACFD